jgi:RNA polymerase sigma factor (sigma-70 family)
MGEPLTGREENRLRVPPDEEEFRLLYEQVFPLAYRVGYRFSGRRDEAEDAAQEAFARAFQRWARLRDQPWAVGWILTTTLNILRRTTRRTRDVPPPADQRKPEADLEASLDLWRAIGQLPKRQAQAVILYYLADLSVKNVASAMGCKEGTARAHLDRARKQLARSLDPTDGSQEG